MIDIKKIYSAKNPAFIYDRVSTDEQARTGYSLEHQNESAIIYAHNNKLDIVHVFTIAESARHADRRVFNQMITFAKQFDVKNLIFKSTDRMSRNWKDLALIMDLIEKDGFTVHLYESNKKIHKDSNHYDKFIIGIEQAAAKQRSDEISWHVKRIIEHKVKKGIAPYARPLLGYQYDKQKKMFVIDEAEKWLVNYIFNLYDNEKYTILGLVKRLNDEGHKNKFGRFTKTSMERMIKNPFYTGQFSWHDDLYKGTHEAYISIEQYNNRLNDRSRPIYRCGQQFAFKGLLVDQSGKTLSGETQPGAHNSGKYINYRSKKATIKEKDVFKAVEKTISELKLTEEIAAEIKCQFSEVVKIRQQSKNSDSSSISHRIATLEAENNKLIELLIDGVDPITVKRRMNDNRESIQRLNKQNESVHDNLQEFLLEATRIIDYLHRIEWLYNNAELADRVEIIRHIVDKVVVGASIDVQLKKPFCWLRVREWAVMGAKRDFSRTFDLWLEWRYSA